jgi:hypothetical protein
MKRPDARLILISTAAPTLDSPLGWLRNRALAQSDVKRRGVVTEAKGPDLQGGHKMARTTSLLAIAG